MDPSYQHVQEDLKTAQHVEFLNLLKAMIMMKRVREDKEDEKEPLSAKSLEDYGGKELNNLIKEAVDFCNDTARSQKVKNQLGKALQMQKEVPRYQPLVVAFNAILLDFKDRDVGSLERCSSEDETLYTINDPLVIESRRLSKIAEKGTKCKPDICEIPLERLLNVVRPEGLEDESLKGLVRYMEARPKDWRDARRGSGSRLTWSDVVHCIEVKVSSRKALTTPPSRFDEPYTVSGTISPPWLGNNLTPDTDDNSPQDGDLSGLGVPVTPPRSGSQKREAASTPEGQHTKRMKSEFILSEVPQVNDRNPPLRPEIQCAFYGIELLRATWDKTHSIVTMLRDDNLSIHWYDSQGSILTDTIDIVERLPLLVALLVLFQRFKKPMRGVAGVEPEMTLGGEQVKVGIPASARIRWELKGRRPVTCVPVPAGSGVPKMAQSQRAKRASNKAPPLDEPHPDPGKLLSDHFFKWSWRESTRENESNIITTAKERAAKYLGDHKNDVIDHLPDVKYSRDYPSLSTGHIRQYAGLDVTRARVPSVMVSSKLSEAKFLDGSVMRVKIWEIIRCILLLWRLGIAHSDISLGNLLVNETKDGGPYMVLNDFDLAAVMNPGDKYPQKKGFERTGTKPFMALELLKHSFGTIKRVCRHDLESVIWVLVWLCRKDPTWYHDTHENVAAFKMSYYGWCIPSQMPYDIEKKDEVLWQPVTKVTRTWMFRWGNANMDGQLDGLSEDDVLNAIKQEFPCPKEYGQWDWQNFQVAL